jgi:ATP synthase F1 complex assembly factor 2
MLRRISSDKSSIKKFYRKASIKSDSQGFQILLDNRILKTPTGTPIILPNPLLALAVASEWETQNVYIKLFTMPLVLYI